MQLRYGSYFFPANATAPEVDRDVKQNAAGVPTEETITMRVKGVLDATGQVQCAAAQAAMLAAIRVPFQDLVFLRDDGGIAMAMTNAGALRGVVINHGPQLFGGMGSGFEFVSGRTFEFTATATYPSIGFDGVLSFTESLRFSGGGPRRDMIETINTPPIAVMLANFTAYRAVQTGQALVLSAYPVPPGPLWPDALLTNPELEFTAPDKNNFYFGARWVYQFASAQPLLGRPSLWR